SGKSTQAESTQHRTETDFDANQFETAVPAAVEDDIGDPRHPLPHYVHYLGIEDIAHEQNFVRCQRLDRRGDRERGRVLLVIDHYTDVLEAFYSSTQHQQVRMSTA